MSRFCIDPGHGGSDPGADGPTGLYEAPVVLEISKILAGYLIDFEQEVILTRETEVYVALETRCKVANDWGADYFVSVHLNSDGESAQGIETLYKSEAGLELAIPLQDALIRATGETDRGVKKRDDLYVLNCTEMPAVLLELGFISHPATETKLRDEDYLILLARTIGEALLLP